MSDKPENQNQAAANGEKTPDQSTAENSGASTPADSQAATQNDAMTSAAPGAPATSATTAASDAENAAPSEAATPESSAAATSTAASSAANPDSSATVNSTSGAPASSNKSSTGANKSSTGAPRSSSKIESGHSARHSSTHQSQRSHRSTSKVDASTPEPKRAHSAASNKNAGGKRKRVKLGELDLKTAKIGFLGAGKMTESTINGLIHYAKVEPSRIHVAAPSVKGLERFRALGCKVTRRNYDIFGRYDCDVIFLAFHGYVIKHCYKLGGNRPHPITTNYIPHQRHPIYILSLVSGVSLTDIKRCLLNPDSADKYVYEMHRIMMNTAVGHGLGICAIDCEPDSKKLTAPIRQLLSSIAHLEHVPAAQMDAACAIGGSGLAFSYYFINALADGAFKMGLSRQMAIKFASKTAQCAAQTLLESGKHPAELRDTVSSPSGAAIYGIHVLDKADVASGVTAAVEAAHKRANDLANQDVSS